MPTKRNYEEDSPQQSVHASRQFQVPGSVPNPAKKPRKTAPSEPKRQAHASSVNAIKKRLRDVSRNLERSTNLPADVRVEHERALASYQHELAAAEAEKIRQKMIKKYHMVRFFERQKATRQLKKLRKQLLETKSTEDVDELKAQMHVADVDLHYAQFCPLSEVYISLYPQKKDVESDGSEESKSASTKSKPPLWAVVEKCMEEGPQSLSWLRNRVSTAPAKPAKKQERLPAKPKPKPVRIIDTAGLNRRERRRKLGIAEPKRAKNETFGVKRSQSYAEDEKYRKVKFDDAGADGGAFFTEG